MLVAQLNLEVQHPFAIADKAEVTRLDNPGMNWTNAHLVQLRSINPIKRLGVHPTRIRTIVRIANRLKPGMPFEGYPKVFGNLALVDVHCRNLRR